MNQEHVCPIFPIPVKYRNFWPQRKKIDDRRLKKFPIRSLNALKHRCERRREKRRKNNNCKIHIYSHS